MTVKWIRSLAVLAVLLPSTVLADAVRDRARVVNVEPVYETVRYAVPVRQCRAEHRRGRSYTAPIAGAIIGGAVGNAVGHSKRNKQVGAVVGALLGGSIGADISRRHHDRNSHRRVCSVVDDWRTEEQLVGYDVTYRYAGSLFTTHMSERPGKYLPVRIRVTPAV